MRRALAFTPRLMVFFVSLLALGVVVSFQNCGKAGFDSSGEVEGAVDANSIDPRMVSAPFPLEANLNVVSYMSCPASGAVTKGRDAVDLNNPYFTVRAGAYNNEVAAYKDGVSEVPYSQIFRTSALATEEQSRRLRAGIFLNQDFYNYVQQKFLRSDSDILMQSYLGSPKIQDYKLVMALINEDRSRVDGGFGWDYSLFYPLLGNLSQTVMTNYLVNAPRNGNFGGLPQGFFSALEPHQRALQGSFSWGKTEVDRDSFNTQLRSNLILTLGFGKEAGLSDITQMESPDGDQFKTVYGRGYRMTFSTQASGLVAPKAYMLSDIEEMNMATKPIQSIRGNEGQRWDCFSLRVVRHIDRMDPATGKPYTTLGPHPAKTSNNAQIPGVKIGCPVQTVDSMNQAYTENGVTYLKNLVRLNMARRVLPADFWEVNTDPTFMCAVPTDLAMARGSCYASGDNADAKFIEYDLNDDTRGGGCGSGGKNECPAFVSICYRSY